MLKYASVRFRGRQMRVAYRPGPSDSPGSEIEWWFADLTDQEGEQLYGRQCSPVLSQAWP
jgi:hypothetical protein